MAQDVTVGDKEIIHACKEALAERLGRDRFDVWFSSRVEWKIDSDSLRLNFQDDFTRDWCYRRFYSDVSAVTSQCFQVAGRLSGAKTEFGVQAISVQSFDVASNRCTSESVATDKMQTPFRESSDRLGSKSRSSLQSPLVGTIGTSSSTAKVVDLDSVKLDVQANDDSSVGMSESAVAGRAAWENNSTLDSVTKEKVVVALPSKDDKRQAESVMPIAKQRTLTWENFVTGNCNKMATATVEMVLKSPGVVTPLLVYGPCGSGKTHLVQALAQRFRQIHGARRVVYLSSEQFTNDFMEAIRGSGLPSFRRKYRDVECLILDDVQFLAGKRATLQELKHTLDTLLRQGRQVILVADRSLQELSILGPDVQARLTGGMVCPLEGLDEATRRELLGRLLAESRIKLAPKIVRELADKSSGDARVLFGLVNRLRALSLMLRGSFNEQQALEATQDLLTSCQPTVRLVDIERAVCDVFGLEPKSLQAKGKTKTISQPRMLAMFLARKYTRAAYAEIGDYFGHRRHSTVISAEKKVNEWLTDQSAEEGNMEVAKIREALRNVEANLRVG